MFEIAAGTIDSGHGRGDEVVLDGIVDGRPVIAFELVWRVSDDVAPEWPAGDSRWLLHIDGDPTVDSEFVLATNDGAGRAVSLAVATLLLNAVPTGVQGRTGRLDQQPDARSARRWIFRGTTDAGGGQYRIARQMRTKPNTRSRQGVTADLWDRPRWI